MLCEGLVWCNQCCTSSLDGHEDVSVKGEAGTMCLESCMWVIGGCSVSPPLNGGKTAFGLGDFSFLSCLLI